MRISLSCIIVFILVTILTNWQSLKSLIWSGNSEKTVSWLPPQTEKLRFTKFWWKFFLATYFALRLGRSFESLPKLWMICQGKNHLRMRTRVILKGLEWAGDVISNLPKQEKHQNPWFFESYLTWSAKFSWFLWILARRGLFPWFWVQIDWYFQY